MPNPKPSPNPVPPKGYQLQTGIDVPMGNKLSPDIEDRRDWGSFHKVMGEKGQDFLSYWRDVRNSYPDFHSAYKVLKDTITGMGHGPDAPPPPVSTPPVVPAAPNPPVNPKVGYTRRYANGTIGVWDGHGWRAQK